MIQSMAAVKPLTMASLMLVTVVVIPVRILVNAVVTVFQIFWATPEMKPQIVEKILEITFHTAVKIVLTILMMPRNVGDKLLHILPECAPIASK